MMRVVSPRYINAQSLRSPATGRALATARDPVEPAVNCDMSADVYQYWSRRQFQKYFIFSLTESSLAGCTSVNEKKTHINKFGKIFDYLKDPALRTKEVGDQLIEVKNALITGIPFQGMVWKNIRFIECDFTDAYQIKLEGMEDCLFEGCRFAGIFSFGVAKKVRFNKIEVRGETILSTEAGSRDVLFENSDFRSLEDFTNHWGAMAMRGEARYVNCYAKWFDLDGEERLSIERCRFDTVTLAQHDPDISSVVTIIDTELIGSTGMISAQMASLTIRNCTVDTLNLQRAQVTGDVLIENVKGAQLILDLKTAGTVAVKNCTFNAPEGAQYAFGIGAYVTDQLLIDNSTFKGKQTVIGHGGKVGDGQWQAMPRNQLVRLTRCNIDELNSAWTQSERVVLDQCTVSTVDLSNSRIGNLQIQGSTIAQKLDLRNTRITTHSVKDLAPSKYRQVLLEGSSIKQLSI